MARAELSASATSAAGAATGAAVGDHSWSAATRALLSGLWLLWCALLPGGFVYGMATRATEGVVEQVVPTWGRMGSSVVLVVAGIVFWQASRAPVQRAICGLIAVGMAFGLLGDLFNADLVPITLPNPVLGGIAAFGLGHVAYMLGTRKLGIAAGFQPTAARWWAIVFWQVVAAVGWYFCVYRGDPSSILVWPALPYSLLLAGTAGMMTSACLADRRLWVMALGAALFLLSDMILAVRMFHGSFAHAGHAVWFTYGPGQMLIVFGMWAIPAVLRSRQGA